MSIANYGAAADVADASQQPPKKKGAAANAEMEDERKLVSWNSRTLVPKKQEEEDWDCTMYDITAMPTWKVFTLLKGSAFLKDSVWLNATRSLAIAILVAVITYLTPYASVIDSERLVRLGTFLTIFVGFLLGFYMSSSMTRWYACTVAFMELLDAVRKMQMQMTALGVAKDLQDTLNRYGLLSAWLLNIHLHMHAVSKPGSGKGERVDSNRREDIDTLFQHLDEIRPDIILPHEKKLLMAYPQSYALIWTWVASLIGRMARDGDIPPMASPTYGRILDIVQQAYGSIRAARAPFLIRAPFVYIHTLSLLVHANNLLNAVVFGVVLGLTIPYLIHTSHQLEKMRFDELRLPDTYAQLFSAFCLNVIAPMLYLTLLDTATCMAQPFVFEDARIPFQRFIKVLEQDLKSADLLAEEPPLWDKPAFKQK